MDVDAFVFGNPDMERTEDLWPYTLTYESSQDMNWKKDEQRQDEWL